MLMLPGLLAHVSSSAAGWLVSAVWEGAVLAGFVALCLRLLPGMSAAVRSVIWTVVFLLLVALPFAHFERSGGLAVQGATLHAGMGWAWMVAGVWVAMSLLRAAQLARSALHLRGISKRALVIVDADEFAKVSAACEGIAGRRGVEIFVSPEVGVPSVVGFFSPRILLPYGLLAKISVGDLRQILLHEMEHLRRGDDWTNLLQKVGLVAFPLHPVLAVVERRLCVERELACDDGVMRATGARKAYAMCLANLAEQSLIRRGVTLALGAWERQSELGRRVRRILRGPEGEMGCAATVASMGVLAVGVLAGMAAMARTPELVSFTSSPKSVAVGAVAYQSPMARPVGMQGAHEVMAKAVMPPARVRAVSSAKPVMGVTGAPKVSRIPNAEAPQTMRRAQAMETLIGWDQESVPTPRLLKFEGDSQFTYAAIPVQDGWLIVQL
jgi:beta-lactamase regulating signal transducer with metallopeptidase domain